MAVGGKLGGGSLACASSRLADARLLGPATWRQFATLPPHTFLPMPALSPTMSHGNLAKWHVKEGEEVAPGAVLADIETDKATLAFENQEDGFIAKLLVQEGTTNIAVGTPLAVLVEEASMVAAFRDGAAATPAPKPAAAAAAAAAPKQPSPAAPSTSKPSAPPSPGAALPAHSALGMPSLSPTMDKGNIVRWLVKEGQAVTAGDVLAEIETDKATLSFENQEEGFIGKLLFPDGAKDITVGTTVAIIVEEREHVPLFASVTAASANSGTSPSASPAAAAAAAAPAAAAKSKVVANHRMGPATRMLLQASGLSPSQITPTGPNHIITKGDVLAAIASGAKPSAAAAAAAPSHAPAAAAAAAPTPAAAAPKAAAPKPSAPKPPVAAPAPTPGSTFTDIPNSQMRKVIASRLLASKVSIPGLYLSMDTRLDEANKFRKMLMEQGIKISLNDLVLKAVAGALKEVPAANVYWDDKAKEARPFASVDVCVAVATPGGLITPIVKSTDLKSLQQISQEVRELAGRARENKLKPEEFMGGSFTVTNLGMMGIKDFVAIINPPQAAILAVGTTQQRVVMSGGKLAAETFMTVSLSADHRVYDGELAAALLNAFKGKIENPSRMLLS